MLSIDGALRRRFWPPVDPQGESALLSIVVVHLRGADDLRRCVVSIDRFAPRPCELVIVDNGSDDAAVETVTPPSDLPLTRLRLPRNLGFAAAANAGLRLTVGAQVFFFNPDAELRAGVLPLLRSELAGSVAAVQPVTVLPGRPQRVENAGFTLAADGLNEPIGRGGPPPGGAPYDVDCLSGAALLVRRDALAQVGAFDPSFFAYGEDADLSQRLRARGWVLRVVPEAVVEHRWSAALGAASPTKVRLVERNRVRVAIVHGSVQAWAAAPLCTARRLRAEHHRFRRREGWAAHAEGGGEGALVAAVARAWAEAALRTPGSALRRWVWRRSASGAGTGADHSGIEGAPPTLATDSSHAASVTSVDRHST